MSEMMNIACGFPGDRDESLIAYLYDDMDPAARAAFDAHLPRCARCRDELSALGDVRARLSQWAPPQPAVTGLQSPVPRLQSAASQWWRHVPVWAQVAAAMVFLGVGAGLANLDVHYDKNGLSVRTGWSKPSGAVQDVGPAASVAAGSAAGSPASAPWRADMAALERQLRAELGATAANSVTAANRVTPAGSGAAATTVNDEALRRVKAIVNESEKRQQNELALRIAEVLRDVNAQRQSDLVKIDRSLGVLQNNTGVEVLRTRQQMLNYFASQQRPQ